MSHQQQAAATDLKLFGTFSPATKYEAMLLEKGGEGITEEKAVLVFRILDELVPNLGVYCQLVKLLRNELFDAVYSEQYTGSKGEEAEDTDGYIQRVPFFTLARRVYSQRDERAESLMHKLETVKEMLFEKHKKYEELQENICGLENEIKELQHNIANLEEKGQEKDNKIAELEQTLEEERVQAAQTEHNLTCDVHDLEDELTEARNEAAFLQQYKQAYDNLQNAFIEQPGMVGIGTKRKKAIVSNKKSNIVASVEDSMKLEKQILMVQNAVIQEFDQFLEEHKKSLSAKQGVDVQDPALYEQQEEEIDQEDQQLMLMQERFRKSMDQMAVELELLRQHKVMLEEQLQNMQDSRPVRKPKKQKDKQKIKWDNVRPGTQESLLSADLEDEDEEHKENDPFVPQERVFSKYAAMMYTSSDGKTYHEFKDAKYCPSCGEKTVFCPHKIGIKDKVFVMPPEVTHVKIVRPKVRINMELIEKVVEEPHVAGKKLELQSLGAVAEQRSQDRERARLSQQASRAASGVTEAPSLAGDAQFPHTVERLWDDYHQRTRVRRHISRKLEMDHTLSLVEQFMASVLWKDDHGTEEDGFHSILDSLYRFMSERYMNPEIMYLSMHDLLSSLSDYSQVNKMILLFVHVLVGNLDAAVFRYLLLINDFIDQIEWQEVEDFQAFASVIYPFLSEDDLDTMKMGYTSYSENKISKQLVSEYIIYCIMKYREPRFLECENKLLAHPGKEVERMTEKEFVESSDHVLPIVNDKLRCRLYREAEIYAFQYEGHKGAVPILRVAEITSYLALLQLAPMIRDSLVNKVLSSREKEATASILTVSTRATVPPGQDFLLTMSSARNLAYNISRRVNRRRSRRHHEDSLAD